MLRVLTRSTIPLLLLLPGCTYGPVQERATIATVEERFNTHTLAVALNWTRYRDPTGLSAFPDGGLPRVLAEEARFFLCDADSHVARLVARILKPHEMESGFSGWIAGWGPNCFYASVSGRRYSWRHGAVGPVNRRFYRIGLDGTVSKMSGIPDGVQREPETGINLPGETTFLRASASSDRIDLRLAEGRGYVAWFEVHRDGTIHPIGRM